MRTSIVDRSSFRFQHGRRLCLMLAGTVPSGQPNVVDIRNRLKAGIFGPGHVHDFQEGLPFTPPTVEHEFETIIPSAAHVCVGWGNCATSLTPWSCPLLPCEYTVVAAIQYVQARADAKDWLSRLAGKTLVCNCSLDAFCCWAYLLQSMFLDILDDRIVNVPCASTVAEGEHEDPQVMPFETYVAIPDVVDTGLPSDRVIPCAVPWPPSWINLVQKIRSLQRPVMWEFC